MSEKKHKFLSTLIVSVGALLGFEALSFVVGIYQIRTYIYLSLVIYLFHVFWLTFIFDLHLKQRSVVGVYLSGELPWHLIRQALRERIYHLKSWHYFRHYQNYLVLPGVIYWGVVCLLFLNPFSEPIKQGVVITATIAQTVAYWYFKDFVRRRLETHELGLKILSLVKLFAAFLIFAAAVGVAWYFGLGWEFLAATVFALTFVLLYQAMFQHHLLAFYIYFWLLLIALAVAGSSWFVYQYWSADYLGGGLVILAVYNLCWGLLHNHLDRRLTVKLAGEYILMTAVVLSLLLGGHDFAPRIGG